jgi:hypothetical protein
VVEDELRDDPKPAGVSLTQKDVEVAQGAVVRMDIGVIGDVVAVVLERRRVEGEEPDSSDTEVLEVIQLPGEAAEIADAVAVAVAEGAHVRLVEEGLGVPEGIFV